MRLAPFDNKDTLLPSPFQPYNELGLHFIYFDQKIVFIVVYFIVREIFPKKLNGIFRALEL